MRNLEALVFTVGDLREWLDSHKDLPDHMTVWVSPEWGDVAKPLRRVYIENKFQINSYGSQEDALIMDATPEREVPKDGMGKIDRSGQNV